MRVSNRLRNLYARQHADLAGTIGYQAFSDDPANQHSITGEIIDPSLCYPATINLAARINEAPSKATRSRLGLKEDVIAILFILVADCTTAGVTITTKDRFTIPGRSGYFFVSKIKRQKQAGDIFLELAVAVTHQAGDRRNR